jgi:hypothetical protein
VKRVVALLLLAAAPSWAADRISLDNGQVRRDFEFNRGVWRTTAFSRSDGSDAVPVHSEEFHLRFFDDAELTASDFQAAGRPDLRKEKDGGQVLRIEYRRKSDATYSTNAPLAVAITYTAKPGEPFLRKQLSLGFPPRAAVDRLEVERFTTAQPAAWGGRGQPVYVNDRWFFGLEHPAGHSRHTDGNTPKPDAHHFELVGNYSVVELDGRDRETHPEAGLLRLFHFPGYAKETGGTWQVVSQSAVAGVGQPGQRMELAFLDYLDTVRKKPRSFTHYNNWFDSAGKSLKGENFVNVWRAFKKEIEPAGIRLDAMVPDNGWQNGSSVWQPSQGHFPGGMDDLARLGQTLRDEGTSLGLWLALDSTTCNIGWGEKNGYARAKANAYFSQYFAHYCLAQPSYRIALEQQLRALVKQGRLTYYKHDFNHLSCMADGHGHAPTDRHGHEANVDAMIELLAACREVNPDLFQNLTNWIWFSPWWLLHGDALWMLAGDDGFNGNTPELSIRAMATTDRDTYLWRMWGNPADRPLVPVSHLMTHGIIRNPGGQMESPQDTVADWADHVMMYYGRGIQMKEWYITPAAMTPDYWRVLLGIHQWSASNFPALVNTVWVGGRPDEGQAYGYVGWAGDRGVLTARNPSVAPQILRVPCDSTTWFRGKPGRAFRARVVYPYHDGWPAAYRSGEPMEFTLPGYATMAFELEPGEPLAAAKLPEPPPAVMRKAGNAIEVEVAIPEEIAGRADLLVIGHAELPAVTLGGVTAPPARSSKSALNQFAGYARAGMPSTNARPWQMASYDLETRHGQRTAIRFATAAGSESTTFEAWMLIERPVAGAASSAHPWSPAEGARRQTFSLVPRTTLEASPVARRALTVAELSSARSIALRLDVFGVNGGEFGRKEVWMNGAKVGELPECGDDWKPVSLPVPAAQVKAENVIEIRHNGREDKFKFRGTELRVELADGGLVASGRQKEPQTSFADWLHGEGVTFATSTSSVPVRLIFGP